MIHIPRRSLTLHLLLVLTLAFVTISASLTPVSAQTKQPYPVGNKSTQICSCIQKAIELLGKYNIPPTALESLLPLLNDPKALLAELTKYKLDETTINALLTEALPLIKGAGLSTGAVEDFLAQGADDTLVANNVPPEQLDALIKDGSDKTALTADLKKDGASDETIAKVEANMNYYESMGLDKTAHAHLLAHDAINLMTKYGLSPAALNDLLPNVNDPQAMAITLTKLGLSPDKIQAMLTEAGPIIKEGLDANVPLAYVAQAVSDTLYGKGLTEDEIKAALAVRDDAKAFAAELTKDGLSIADINAEAQQITAAEALGLDDKALAAVEQETTDKVAGLDKALDPNDTGTMDNKDVPVEPTDAAIENPPADTNGAPDANTPEAGNGNQAGDTPVPMDNPTAAPADNNPTAVPAG